MSIGQFNKRLLIKEKIKTPNGRGGATVTEQEIGDEVWCKIRLLSAKERMKYNALEKEVTAIIEIRYHPLIKPGKNYVCYIGERKFEVTVPIDKEQSGRFYELPALEVF